MTAAPNPIATHNLPFFITAPGDTDVLFNITLLFVVGSIVLTGVIFLTIHSLPERMAHKSKKIQLDIVALLCLLALLTHEHLFWFAAILLAFIDIPDFLPPVKRIASSVESIAGQEAAAGSPGDQSDSNPPKAVPADQPRQDRKGAAHAYTTLGYGDVVPVTRWRLLGPLTAMNGVLLFGWSTTVIFEAAECPDDGP